jgi:hypothetical protein
MATQTQNSVTDNLEGAAAKVGELNERAVETGRKASVAYIDSYEKAAMALADSIEKAGGATKVDWLESVAAKQAKASREVTKAYTASLRQLVV